MKKHIVGFALFSLIVASFVLIYAFFSAPSLLPREAVKPPVSQVETRVERPYSCRFRKSKLSYEFISSQFDLENNELTSKVKVNWNGFGETPKRIFAKTSLFRVDGYELSKSIEPSAFTKVFENRDEATLIIISKLDKGSVSINERQNLYVDFAFSEDYPDEDLNQNKNLTQAHQVLFIHGDN